MLFHKKHSNIDEIVINLVKYCNIPITKQTIIDELERHPDYPSLLAISDILNTFNISNGAFNITNEQLFDVPIPFIAHMSSNGGEFVLVEKIENDQIKYDGKQIELKKFYQKFSGTILAIESINTAGEANYREKKRKEILNSFRIPLSIIGVILIAFLALSFHSVFFSHIRVTVALAAIFKSLGLIVSILLLVQSIDNNNPLVQILCQSGTNKNCTAILSSKYANVFNWLTWSEVGFFYFSGSWLALIFNSTSTSVLQFLSIISILSLPYTFYSIYYQARIAKQWCVLCCSIQALLWLEFLSLYSNLSLPLKFINIQDLTLLIMCFLSPIIFWVFTKPFFLKSQQVSPLKAQLQKFKFNTELFNKILTSEPKFANPDKSWAIVLGNTESTNIITMVSNPYCNPCTKAHHSLSELLNSINNIQVRIIFVSTDKENDRARIFANHMMSLDALGDMEKTENALSDWYNRKDYTEWSKIHAINVDESISYKSKKQAEWCKIADITGTPTILINGYKLPPLYQITDIKYMLPN